MFNHFPRSWEAKAAILLMSSALGGCALHGNGLQSPLKPIGGEYETAYQDYSDAAPPNGTVDTSNITNPEIRAQTDIAIEAAYAADAVTNASIGYGYAVSEDLGSIKDKKLRVQTERAAEYGFADLAATDITLEYYSDAQGEISEISNQSLLKELNVEIAQEKSGNEDRAQNIADSIDNEETNRWADLNDQANKSKNELYRHTKEYNQQYEAAQK
jgi:hypothetical protein